MKMLTAKEVFIYDAKTKDLIYHNDTEAYIKIETPEVQDAMLKQVQKGSIIFLAGFQVAQLNLTNN